MWQYHWVWDGGRITWACRVKVILPTPKRSDIAIQIPRRKLFCFYILLFNDFISFSARVYEINMYLLLYLSFKIKVYEYTQLHYITMLFMRCYNHFWRHNRLHCDAIMPFHCFVMLFRCSVMSHVHYHCLEHSIAGESHTASSSSVPTPLCHSLHLGAGISSSGTNFCWLQDV